MMSSVAAARPESGCRGVAHRAQVRGELGFGLLGDLGQDVAHPMEPAPNPQRVVEADLDRVDQPLRAVGGD
jgi:hypothetical protein